METKKCKHCKKVYKRKKDRTLVMWNAQKYCRIQCVGQANIIPLKEKLKIKSKLNKKTGCIEWIGFLNKGGYGEIKRPCNGGGALAHRISWELTKGKIPKGLCVLHKCDNRRCINPEHLFLGTRADNQQDMLRKGRSTRGEKHGRVKLTNEQVLEIRKKYKNGMGIVNISKEYPVNFQNISFIINRKTWKHLL